MTKVTPWDEARESAWVSAIDAYNLHPAVKQTGKRVPWSGDHPMAKAIDAALATLSRHGYRLVLAEGTPEMERAFFECPSPQPIDGVNAATEAGDVLKVKP